MDLLGKEALNVQNTNIEGDNQLGCDGGIQKKKSKFRGVCWNKKNNVWQAAINIRGKYLYLGSYKSEELAARAFDREAIKFRGERAKVNFADSKQYFKALEGTGYLEGAPPPQNNAGSSSNVTEQNTSSSSDQSNYDNNRRDLDLLSILQQLKQLDCSQQQQQQQQYMQQHQHQSQIAQQPTSHDSQVAQVANYLQQLKSKQSFESAQYQQGQSSQLPGNIVLLQNPIILQTDGNTARIQQLQQSFLTTSQMVTIQHQ